MRRSGIRASKVASTDATTLFKPGSSAEIHLVQTVTDRTKRRPYRSRHKKKSRVDPTGGNSNGGVIFTKGVKEEQSILAENCRKV